MKRFIKSCTPTYKIADTQDEFDQIHRLNYETFVQEIPQHPRNPDGVLVDKFHEENTYLVCLDGDTLAGMLAVRGKRPFSLDAKLPNLDTYLPPCHSVCEIRLLAVRKEYRFTVVFSRLAAFMAAFCGEKEYDMVVISGTVRQIKLYRHIGFTPFGPVVGTPEAHYQPMYMAVAPEAVERLLKTADRSSSSSFGKVDSDS